ncbi:hypothetical protein [Aeromicrobium sp. UC242_57]|uniref:hypothetical protein n=1 Tax=Aeromicrobium sp. UC242_57 TaxID=3374624 RepID=UPI003798D7B6
MTSAEKQYGPTGALAGLRRGKFSIPLNQVAGIRVRLVSEFDSNRLQPSSFRLARSSWRRYVAGMVLVILLIILAIVTGVLGAIIKGAFWLFILTVVFLVGAFYLGRSARAS